jgi:DNA repair protein RadA
MASPDVFFGDPTRPVGGNVVAHTSTYRIYFKKSGKKRIARMVDSPHHPEEEVIFALGEAGVIDPEEAEKKTKKSTKKVTPKPIAQVSMGELETPEVETMETPEVETTAKSSKTKTVKSTVDVKSDDSEPLEE